MWARLAPGLLIALLCAGLLSYDTVERHLRGAAMLARWTHAPAPASLLAYGDHEVRVAQASIALPIRTIATLRYEPVGVRRPPPVMLLHGAHHLGIRESRLQAFARALASAGALVVTPQLDELTTHHLDRSTIPLIQALSHAVAQRSGYESAVVVGISFAGSLALLAAAEPARAKAIAAVAAVGSYASLDRIGHWYAGDPAPMPDGSVLERMPHPYGARVLFQAYADSVFGEHAEAVRKALRAYLHDRPQEAERLARALPEPPRAAVLELTGPAAYPLSGLLREQLKLHARELAAASPDGQLRELRTPVLLIHGSDDPVVPSSETWWLARELPAGMLQDCVVTSAIRHAELDHEPSVAELWELVHWAAWLLNLTEAQARAPRL